MALGLREEPIIPVFDRKLRGQRVDIAFRILEHLSRQAIDVLLVRGAIEAYQTHRYWFASICVVLLLQPWESKK